MQEIHSRLQRHVRNRLQAIEKGTGLDWATAEASGSSCRLADNPTKDK
jgi:probable 2-oxoglutarate dehydrogenase E1 component DHKTD1